MTTSASLASPAFFTPSLFSLQSASNSVARSTARLSSGNRITSVGDDVAAFSIASRLQSQLSGLKQASQNTAQASSLLQVAEGGLTQILDLLDSAKAVATQANSASLTTVDRSFLQQQFEAYLAEIDQLSSTTSFNGISLLSGAFSGANKAFTQTSAATKATGSLVFTGNVGGGLNIVLNGVTFTEGVDFDAGGSIAATIDDLIDALEESTDTRISQATYERSGNTLIITSKSGGTIGNQFVIDKAASTATAAFTVSGGATSAADVYTLSGGLDNGLNINSTQVSGAIGDAFITAQSQVAASVTLFVSGAISDSETLSIDNGNGGTITFTFKDAATPGGTEIQIGATTEETLQNAISTITAYSVANAANNNYGLRQLDFRVNGNNLIITNKNIGNALDLSGVALDISEGIANATLSGSSFNNGINTGVNVSGVNNGDFVGTIQGFTASYVSADKVNVSITIGSSVYTATIEDTTPAGDTTVRFTSTDGGYFDVQLDGGQGTTVGAGNADDIANRLNAAFSSLNFTNNRSITNFSATGSFIGASAQLQLSNFSDVRLDSIKVTTPSAPGADGTIEFVINGETFRASSGIGGRLGAYESLTLVSLTDANNTITIRNGSTAQDFSTANAAATLQSALRTAFGLTASGSGVNFQIGSDAADTINVVIENAGTEALFNGVTPDVTSQSNAAAAQTAIDTARNAVLSNLSNVGALESRFSAALNAINSTIEGVSAARSNLADTDILSESTDFAQNILKVNAGIAVIAQARSLQSGLLGLLQFSK